MMKRESFEAIDRSIRDACGSNEPFGGILTVCSGGFRQLLPVVKRGIEADIYNACIKESYLWRKFTKFNLKRNMRVREEGNEYSQFLINISKDKIEKNENGEIALPADMIIPAISVDECIEYIYPALL